MGQKRISIKIKRSVTNFFCVYKKYSVHPEDILTLNAEASLLKYVFHVFAVSWFHSCHRAAASLRLVGSSSKSVPASATCSADYRRIKEDRRQRLECGSWSPLWGFSAVAPPAPSPPPPSHSLPVSSRPCAPHPSRHSRTEPPHVRAAFIGSNYILASRYIKPGSGIADVCLPADRRFWTVSRRAIGRKDAWFAHRSLFILRRLSLRGSVVGGLFTSQHSHVRRHLMGVLVASLI